MGARQATILFVDDNPALLRSVERLLRVEGFGVLLASDGEEALRVLADAAPPPDLIISDIAMPNMDGFEFFEAVRARPEWLSIPFLFLTARDQIEDLRRGYLLGADDYLVKPLDQERLVLIIRAKLKRAGELMEHIHVQQEALDAAKRELAQLVAHELRTPLVSIAMVTDILAREMGRMGADQLQDLLDTMQTGSSRLSRLVEQMVMFVQMQSGALEDTIRRNKRPGSLRDVVTVAIERARQFAYRQRDIPVTVDEPFPLLLVDGDLHALLHALAELIANAKTFSKPDGSVVIWHEIDGGLVHLVIEDQGMGIPSDELERVLEPYYQAQRKRHEQQGIGVGLPLARGIIRAHGGTLELRSRVGQGTQAIVTLPLSTDLQ
ncbi:MAG: response regulator [Anaerolineae bacterium]|nr:response regulator [Anaerolineae bacterium]